MHIENIQQCKLHCHNHSLLLTSGRIFLIFIFTIVYEILERKIQISSSVLRRDYKLLVYSVKKKRQSKTRFPCIACLAVARHNNTHNIDPNYLIFGPIVPYIALNYIKQQLVSEDHALVTPARMQQNPHATTFRCVSSEMGT